MSKKILFTSLVFIFIGMLAVFFVGSFLIRTRQVDIVLDQNALPFQNVFIHSKSGSLLAGWFLEGDENKGGVLLMHGIGANRLQMLARAKFLHKAGYTVLLFDFQGHGESKGDKVTFGYLESMDAEAAYSFLLDKLEYKSIGVIGISLGGASALLGGVVTKSKALILESVYPTIEEAISNRLVMRLGHLGKYLVPLLTWQIKVRLGFNPKELRPIEHISTSKGSVYIISGEEDHHTTLDESKRLFAAANEPKKIWIVPGASHIDLHQFEQKTYEVNVLRFLNNNL